MLDLVQADPLLRRRLDASTLRHEIAQRFIEAEIMYQFSMRIISMQNKGQLPNDEASMAKLYNSELSQRVAQTCMAVMGLRGQLTESEETPARMYLGMVAGDDSRRHQRGPAQRHRHPRPRTAARVTGGDRAPRGYPRAGGLADSGGAIRGSGPLGPRRGRGQG